MTANYGQLAVAVNMSNENKVLLLEVTAAEFLEYFSVPFINNDFFLNMKYR